jgi:phenylacetate-CoA ligase
LSRLPFTEKDELRKSQEQVRPLGGNQGAPLDQIVRIQATGGTSGVPMRIGFTPSDIAHYNATAARCVHFAGAGPGDLVFQCMNYSLYVGGVSDHMALEAAGCCVFPHGVGNSKRLIALAGEMEQPWSIYATPAYAMRLAEVALDMGLDPRELGLARGLLSGEAGLGVPGFRERLEEIWGFVARDIYGLSETGFVGAEDSPDHGLAYLAADSLIAELVDPMTGESMTIEKGARGELVYTTVEREASFLIRFRSHDLVEVTASEDMASGVFRFRLLGRSDDMFIVRGVNVFPLGVQDVLLAMGPETTGEFQIVLEHPPPIDYDPLVRVEGTGAGIGERIRHEIQARLNFTPRIEVVAPGTLPRFDGKARRLVHGYEATT